MFQNITDEEKIENAVEETVIQEKIDIKSMLKKSFTKQNILVYIISFMLSTVTTINGIAPFGLAIFAATISTGLPGGIVFLFSLIGTLIGTSLGGTLSFILTSLVLIAMCLIFKPWYEEEYKSERRRLGKYVFLSALLVQILQVMFSGFLLYDFFLGITTAVVTYIFYKIFSNSLAFFSEYGITKVFTIEEVVGASLMLAIAFTAFRDFQIFGFEIKSILCILIVLVLGWKKGILIRRDKWYYNWCSAWRNRRRNTDFSCIICIISE